jgi:hypothetical protein
MKKHLFVWPITDLSGYLKNEVPKYDSVLTHEGTKRGYPILMGGLGLTYCCGAASILVPRIPASGMELIDLFKSSGKSILHYIGSISGVYGDSPTVFPTLIKDANIVLAGIAEISMYTLEPKEHVLTFQTKDLQKTRDFFARMP